MCEDIANKMVAFLRDNPKSCAIIENDDEFGILLVELMRRLGFTVIAFKDGSDFLKVHKRIPFDVIIFDWDSSQTRSDSLEMSINSIGSPLPIFFILCDLNATISFHSAMRPSAFIFKPFNVEHIVKTICAAIGGNNGTT